MLMSVEQQTTEALLVLEKQFGAEIVIYLRKVIAAERRATKLSPEDIISSAYIVLNRAVDLYDPKHGPFRNYAIRSLRNEFLRSKSSSELSYDSFVDDLGTSMFQPTESDTPYMYQSVPTNKVESSTDAADFENLAIALISTTCQELSSLEQSLVYLIHCSSMDGRRFSLRAVASDFGLSYYTLLVTLKQALRTLRLHLDDAGYTATDANLLLEHK